MNCKILKKIAKIGWTAFTTLFALMVTACIITGENADVISAELGQQTFIKTEAEGYRDTDYYKTDYESIAALKADGQSLVEDVLAGGAVLLKNENGALPLSEGSKVSLFGVESLPDYTVYFGNSSAKISKPDPAVSFAEGMMGAGMQVNTVLSDFYKSQAKFAPDYKKFKINDASWSDIESHGTVFATFDDFGDAAIVVVSRSGGEGSDLPVDDGSDGEGGNYLALNANEKSVFSGLAALKGEKFSKIVVILNSANQIEAGFLNDPAYKIDAALWVGFPGQTGLNAVGKILTGEINPSGKLPDTYWTAHAHNPALQNFGASTYGNYNADDFKNISGETGDLFYNKYVVYQEGVYVGYRYTETRYYDCMTKRENCGAFSYNSAVAYPFGYGLSYTQFEYSDVQVDYKGSEDVYELSVKVANIGDVAGRESVQFYLSKPYTEYDIANGVEKPVVELVGYAKTSILDAGKSETLTVTVAGSELASYDALGAKTYVLSEGEYKFIAGRNAHAAVNDLLAFEGRMVDGNAELVKSVEKKFDATSYSKRQDGEKLTNLFDYGDINLYENKGDNIVVYTSRNDWAGTLPSDTVTLSLNDGMVADILAQNNSEHIQPDDSEYPAFGEDNGLVLVDLRRDANDKVIPIENDIWEELVDQISWEDMTYLLTQGKRQTVGVINIAKPATVEHNGPLGITQKYEFGQTGLASLYQDCDKDVCATYYPSMNVLAASYDTELAERVGKMIGEDALWAGYSGLYGVSVNVHRTAYDGRNAEYYSEDGLLSGRQAANFTVGLQSKGCNGYVKHIAGYEQQACRIGLGVWSNEQAYREVYLKAFKVTVQEGNVMNAMTAYSRIGVVNCPASYELCTEFLRGECGLKGIVVSDMWDKRYNDNALVRCLMAGMDVPDGDRASAGDATELYEKYRSGYANVAKQMRLAAKHILYATVHSNAMNGYDSGTTITPIMPTWQKWVVAGTVTSGALFVIATGGMVALNVWKREG